MTTDCRSKKRLEWQILIGSERRGERRILGSGGRRSRRSHRRRGGRSWWHCGSSHRSSCRRPCVPRRRRRHLPSHITLDTHAAQISKPTSLILATLRVESHHHRRIDWDGLNHSQTVLAERRERHLTRIVPVRLNHKTTSHPWAALAFSAHLLQNLD